MNETRILIRLLRMYIPRNWEFGSALAKLRNLGGGLFEPLKSPQYATGHDHAVLKATSQGHGTARLGSRMGTAWYLWITIGRPQKACERPAHVRFLPATTRNSTKFVIRSITISEAVRIFPSTTRNFTKDAALSENGVGAAWHVWSNAAGERQGNCKGTAWYVWINCNGAFRDVGRSLFSKCHTVHGARAKHNFLLAATKKMRHSQPRFSRN
jgi:hypothetical protein